MKNIILSTIITLAFFASCEKHPPGEDLPEEKFPSSIENTTWAYRYEYDDNQWDEEVLVFSSSLAIYTRTSSSGHTESSAGTYVYNPPTVTITVTSPASLAGFTNTGTIDKKTIEIGIHQTNDLIMITTLTKQ